MTNEQNEINPVAVADLIAALDMSVQPTVLTVLPRAPRRHCPVIGRAAAAAPTG